MNDKNDELDLLDYQSLKNKYSHYGSNDDAGNGNEDGFSPSYESESTDSGDSYEDISSRSDDFVDDDYEMPDNVDLDFDSGSGFNPPEKNPGPEDNGGFFKRNNYRNAKLTALILAIVILLSAGGFMIYIYLATRSDGYGKDGVAYNDTDDYIDDENLSFKAMGDVDADSLNDYLKSWALNGGEKLHSKNVINVLLCGVDSDDGKAKGGRSDSMILVSVNKKQKTVTMVSILRDSWSYMSLPNEDGTYYDYYFKLNSAYGFGGPATLIKTIENNFKVEIDQYIAVDFASFPKLIDALGGVTVEVKEYETDYIRRTSSQKQFPYGKAKLNGKQALIYSRIRHCDADADVSRTRRQRSVIKALIDAARTATKGQLLNAFKQTADYMQTGYSQSEVLKLIATAYSHKWMEFEMKELMLPNEDYKDRLATYVGSQSCWVVDYALCAQKLQNALYGESNVILNDNRSSVIDLVNGVHSSGSSNSSSSDSYSGSSSYDSSYDSSYTQRTYSYSDYDEDEDKDEDEDTYSGDSGDTTSETPQEEPATEKTNIIDRIINGGGDDVSDDTPAEEEAE